MPFTMAALTIFVFNIGLYQTVPVYVATLVSYILVCGTGMGHVNNQSWIFKRRGYSAIPLYG